jgi:hypothetical protein
MSSEPCVTWWLFRAIASVHPMHPLLCTINCCSTTNRQRNAPLFTSLGTDSVCASWLVGSTRGPDRTCKITGGPCAQTERSVTASTLDVLLPRSQGLALFCDAAEARQGHTRNYQQASGPAGLQQHQRAWIQQHLQVSSPPAHTPVSLSLSLPFLV